MTKKLKDGLKLSGCSNCKRYNFVRENCKKGNDANFSLGAHFLCDDFEQLPQSPVSSRSVIDNYFMKR